MPGLSILPTLLCLAHPTDTNKKDRDIIGLLLYPGRLTCSINRESAKPGFVVTGHRSRQSSSSLFVLSRVWCVLNLRDRVLNFRDRARVEQSRPYCFKVYERG